MKFHIVNVEFYRHFILRNMICGRAKKIQEQIETVSLTLSLEMPAQMQIIEIKIVIFYFHNTSRQIVCINASWNNHVAAPIAHTHFI